jgi:hypothetical protein
MVNRVADLRTDPDDEEGGVDDDLKFKLPDVDRAADKRKGGGFLDSEAGQRKQQREARLAAIKEKEDGWRVRPRGGCSPWAACRWGGGGRD